MRVKIISSWYPVDEGATITENFNQTLDSANIRISHLYNEINIEPYDDVILHDDNNRLEDKYMCVDSYTRNEEGLDNPTYSYEISLFSLTKKLENIILPNLSITPHRTGVVLNIYDYLKRYLDVYKGNNNWVLSDRCYDKFGPNIENSNLAPELQWSTPTLREVFDTLMMVKDCICVLKYQNNRYEIDYMDLTETNDMGVKSGINYIQQSQSSDDYISEIRMQLQNVMQTSVKNVNNVIRTTEYVPFTSDEWRVTDENFYIKTQFPILRVNHLWIYLFPYNYEGNSGPNPIFNQKMIKVDLCNLKTNEEDTGGSLLKEIKEYETLPILYRTDLNKNADISEYQGYNVYDYFSKYKNYCIYYTRGNNKIEGFSATSKQTVISIGDATTLQWIKNLAVVDAVNNGLLETGGTLPNFINEIKNPLLNLNCVTYYSTFFQIEYETTYNATFSASKEIKPRNRRVIADNQDNAWVDIYSQGFLEYQKANRLGNKSIMINQRTQGDDFIKIQDKRNKDIVFRTQYQIYQDFINVNAWATPHFVLQNYFTGIKSKVRTWVNAKDEALQRHDLVKLYCEMSYSQKTEQNISSSLARYLLSCIETIRNKPIRYAGVNIYTGAVMQEEPKTFGLYSLNCATRLVGKSIVITFGFDDNWFVSKHVYYDNAEELGIYRDNIHQGDSGLDSQDRPVWYPPYIRTAIGSGAGTQPYGGVPLNNYGYTDSRGEFNRIEYLFANDINLGNDLPTISTEDITEAQIKDLFQAIFDLPKVQDNAFSSSTKFSNSLEFVKDNKEIPIISTQFEFRTDSEDIIITEAFAKEQEAIRSITLTEGAGGHPYGTTGKPHLKIYSSNVLQRTLPDNKQLLNNAFYELIELNNSSCQLEFHNLSGDYIYVCDNNNNLLFAFKKQESDTTNLFFNIRRNL